MKVSVKNVKITNVELTECEVRELKRIVKEGKAIQALSFLCDINGMMK